jgi:hypothetical protein
MTVGEKIRKMTDEELTKYIQFLTSETCDCSYLPCSKFCTDTELSCYDAIKAYLKSDSKGQE